MAQAWGSVTENGQGCTRQRMFTGADAPCKRLVVAHIQREGLDLGAKRAGVQGRNVGFREPEATKAPPVEPITP